MKIKLIATTLLILIATIGAIFLYPKASSAVMKVFYGVTTQRGLVGFWNFDDADSGTNAADKSGEGNNGTMQTTCETTAGSLHTANGKIGNAISTDGSNDCVNLTSHVSDYNSLSVGTLSLWFKLTTGGPPIAISKGSDATAFAHPFIGDFTGTFADESLCFVNRETNANQVIICYRNGHSFLLDDNWHHAVYSSDGSTNKIYIDGERVPVSTSIAGAHSGVGFFNLPTADTLLIGARKINGAVDSVPTGSIDEVRIYDRALSDGEARHLFEQGAGSKIIARRPNNTGLVGHWNFDDADSGTTVKDFSGEGNTGTMYTTCATGAGSLHTANGKIGNGINLDGSNDCVNIANSSSIQGIASAGTISFWINLDQNADQSDTPVDVAGTGTQGLAVLLTSTNLVAFRYGTGGGQAGPDSVTALTPGQWFLVTVTWDSSGGVVYINGVSEDSDATAPSISIAQANTFLGSSESLIRFVDSKMDEIRFYNRALSASEVSALFDETKRVFVNVSQNNRQTDGLVGLWSFNGPDVSGTTAFDRSGSGNDGTLTNGPTVIPGIIGQALDFDGSDDFVDIADQSTYSPVNNDISISLWVKIPASVSAGGNGGCDSSGDYLFTKGATSNWEWALENDSNTLLCFILWQLDGTLHATISISRTLNDSQWHHYAATVDYLNNVVLYIDGVEEGSTTSFTGVMSDGTANLNIGTLNANTALSFGGLIDEVRIYNRTLSADEIKRLYESGRRE